MEKKELLLILNRVMELYFADLPEDISPEMLINEIENDKYIKEQGFTFDKLSEEINKL